MSLFKSTLGRSFENAGDTMAGGGGGAGAGAGAAAAARLARQRFSWRRSVTPNPVRPRRPAFWPQRQHAALAGAGLHQPPGPNPTLVCAWARQLQEVRLYL